MINAYFTYYNYSNDGYVNFKHNKALHLTQNRLQFCAGELGR